ncbi:MAG TPA: SDR family oxidoreductase [Chitinophagaceae bacterium]|nr:SDR family oxidoreductase [Chitinophagaceae bacterium]
MITILITGANGFLGSYLCELLTANYKIIATGKGNCRLHYNHANLYYEKLDFTVEGNVKEVLRKHSPEIIIHAGAMSKPDECESNKEQAYLSNVQSTLFLLKQASLLKSFFIFLSTDFIFDGVRGMYKEEDIPGPVNYYGETKLLAENEVKKYLYQWCIVRTVLVYGHPKSGRDNILTVVAKGLEKGETLRIFDDQLRTPTYVEDLANAIKTIIKRKTTGVFHVSGADKLSPYEMAIAVANYLGLDETLVKKVTAETFQQPALRPAKTGFDISKAKDELNFIPTSFSEGLKKTLKPGS